MKLRLTVDTLATSVAGEQVIIPAGTRVNFFAVNREDDTYITDIRGEYYDVPGMVVRYQMSADEHMLWCWKVLRLYEQTGVIREHPQGDFGYEINKWRTFFVNVLMELASLERSYPVYGPPTREEYERGYADEMQAIDDQLLGWAR